jgi:hypothetical protein
MLLYLLQISCADDNDDDDLVNLADNLDDNNEANVQGGKFFISVATGSANVYSLYFYRAICNHGPKSTRARSSNCQGQV